MKSYLEDDAVMEESILLLSEDEEDDEIPNFAHGRLQTELLWILRTCLKPHVAAYSPITFRGKIRRYTPDVVVYPKRTVPLAEEAILELTPPMLAVEIISPGQTMAEMVKKCREMITSGVEECWIIEPANESVTICRQGAMLVLHHGEEIHHTLLTRNINVDELFDV
jgi:Uma2 family endonuclease